MVAAGPCMVSGSWFNQQLWVWMIYMPPIITHNTQTCARHHFWFGTRQQLKSLRVFADLPRSQMKHEINALCWPLENLEVVRSSRLSLCGVAHFHLHYEAELVIQQVLPATLFNCWSCLDFREEKKNKKHGHSQTTHVGLKTEKNNLALEITWLTRLLQVKIQIQ